MENTKGFYIEVAEDGNIEQCRQLCEELMAFQKSKAVIAKETFDMMTFETRFVPSYKNAVASHVAVVKRDNAPEGYIFSTIEDTQAGDKSKLPDWTPVEVRERIERAGGAFMGFYPDWAPVRCGCLNHLYLRECCRGTGLGAKLFDMSMEWMREYPVDCVFVYISNGNEAALDFYLKHGFTYSHDVLGGFIKAAYYKF